MLTDIVFTLFEYRSPAYNDARGDRFFFLFQTAERKMDGKDQIVDPEALAKEFHEAEIFFDFSFAGVVNGNKGVIDFFPEKGIDYVRDAVIKMEVCIRCILECRPVSIRTLRP